jgi:hypothetical protein
MDEEAIYMDEFNIYKSNMQFLKQTGLRPENWKDQFYKYMVCPIIDPSWEAIALCVHPPGYHEWLEENPWANTIECPPEAS